MQEQSAINEDLFDALTPQVDAANESIERCRTECKPYIWKSVENREQLNTEAA